MDPEQDGQLNGVPLRSFAMRCNACGGLYELGRGLRMEPPAGGYAECSSSKGCVNGNNIIGNIGKHKRTNGLACVTWRYPVGALPTIAPNSLGARDLPDQVGAGAHPAVRRVSTTEKIFHAPPMRASWKASTPQCENRGPT